MVTEPHIVVEEGDQMNISSVALDLKQVGITDLKQIMRLDIKEVDATDLSDVEKVSSYGWILNLLLCAI